MTLVSPMANVHAHYEIAHPDCVQPHVTNYQGCINKDLPNS